MRRLVAILLFAGAANAQVTRTEAQSVLVDVLVTDKKGAYVAGLTAKDFQVWEDGKEQTVDGLFTEKGSAAPVRPTMVLLFDNSSMTSREQTAARQVALRILDQATAGDPNIAVLDFGGALRVSQTFTNNVTRAKQAVVQPKGGPLSADTGAVSDFTVRDLLRALDGLVKNLQASPGRKSLIFFSPGYSMNSDFDMRLKEIIGEANQSNVSFYPVNVRVETGFSSAISDVSSGPAPSAGRGGRGTPAPNAGRNVAMPDPTTTSGTAVGPAQLGMLQDLAKGTGGFVVRQPDDQAALSKIALEQNEFYVLSYTPPDSPSGSCHKLRVKVKRDDLTLRSREGYCKRTLGDVLSGNPVERSLEQKALADKGGNIAGTMQAPYFYKAANVARVAAVIGINPASVAFKKDKNKFLGQLDILGIATKEDDSTGARFSDVVKLEFDTQAQVDEFKRTPYRYENQFDIAPGKYKLAVVLGAGAESFGRLQTALEIEPYAAGDFSLSGIVLSREYRSVTQGVSGLDEFLIDDRKKWIAEGVEVLASTSSKFSAAGQVGIFVEVYEPLLKSDPELVVAVQMRILERAGSVKVDTGMLRLDLVGKQSATVIPMALNVPVKGLAPGNYVLEFQAFNSQGKSAKRTAPFELE